MKRYIKSMGYLQSGQDHTSYHPIIDFNNFNNIIDFAHQTKDAALADGILRCVIADAATDRNDPNLPHTQNTKSYYRRYYDAAAAHSALFTSQLLQQLDRLTI